VLAKIVAIDAKGKANKEPWIVYETMQTLLKMKLNKVIELINFHFPVLTSVTIQSSIHSLEAIDSFLIGPNPVNINLSTIHFSYVLNETSDITMYIYDVSGRLVKKFTYLKNTSGAVSGQNKWQWNGITDYGTQLTTGVYFVYMVTDSGKSKKVTLMVVK